MAPLKRDFIDHLDLFQVIFMRLPILNTLDFVCVMRKQEHVMFRFRNKRLWEKFRLKAMR